MIPKVKKPGTNKQETRPTAIFMTANYFTLAIVLRILYQEHGFRAKRLGGFIASYLALMAETSDGRNSVNGMIRDTKELTGIDVKKIINEVLKSECA